jgi:PAS domain S-box-containing protein
VSQDETGIESHGRRDGQNPPLTQQKKNFALYELAPVGYFTLDRSGVVVEVNIRGCNLLDIEQAKLCRSSFFDYVAPHSHPIFSACFETLLKIGGQEVCELELVKENRSMFHARLDGIADRDATGRVERIYLAVTDITLHKQNERKAMEALIESEKRFRGLSQELIKAHENERKMISCELHDRVAQDLSMLKISCETLFDGYPEVPDKVKEKIDRLSGMLEKTIMIVRDMSYELSPPGLNEMGLGRTVYMFCQDFSEKCDIKVDFFSAGMDRLKLDPESQINLYRLIQEGLNNIKKHARAGSAVVKLVAASPHIILRMEDDGIGFDVKERELRTTAEKRMGLRSMKERVNLLGGEMQILSMPMKGTKILIRIPIQENYDADKENHSDR